MEARLLHEEELGMKWRRCTCPCALLVFDVMFELVQHIEANHNLNAASREGFLILINGENTSEAWEMRLGHFI